MNNISTIKTAIGFVFALLVSSGWAVQTELPYTTVSRYDFTGQLLGTIGPDPDGAGPLAYPAMRNTYDSRGLLIRTETGQLSDWLDETVNPKDWTSYASFTVYLTKEFAYDNYGRKIREWVVGTTGSIESLVQYNHDVKGRVNCKAVRLNKSAYGSLPASACDQSTQGTEGPDRISRYTYDGLDNVTKEERGLGTPLVQNYKAATYTGFKPLTVIDANGNKTEFRYDKYRLIRIVYPSKTTPGSLNELDYSEFTYDANSNVQTERKRNGKIITNTYDNNNRLIKKDFTDNTYSADVFYNYDLRGLTLHSRFTSDTGQGVVNAFDGFGNLIRSTTSMGGVSRILNYRYDENGNRTRITHPDNWFFAYGFDGLNRVNSLGESASASATASTNSLQTVTYAQNGSRYQIVRTGGTTTTYHRDNALRLGSFAQDFGGISHDLTNTFTYSPASQITQLIQSNSFYTYSGNQQLTGSYVVNGLNQYTSIAGQSVTYDSNGNLVQHGGVTYTYDDENRLVSTSGGVVSSLKYDPLGRLFEATIAGAKTQFLYDGDALVAEYNSAGTLTRRYVHGDQVDEPWLQYNGNLVGAAYRRFLHADHQGSIIAHSSNSGAVLSSLAYDAYGIPKDTNLDRFGYTGQMWLKELGLFHYKARIYSPRLGRFLQTDPIFYEDQMNLYAYVGNDPVNMVDPTGEFGIAGFLIGAGIEAALQYTMTGTIDVSDVVVAGAVGAVTGGFAGSLAKSAATGAITTSAAIKGTAKVAFSAGAAGSAAKSVANGEAPDGKKMALAGVANAAGSAAGAKIANAGAAKLESMGKAGGIQAHIAQATQSKVFPDAAEAAASTTGETGQAAADIAASSAEAIIDEKLK